MKTHYNHLGLCGLYAVVDPKTGEVINVRLHQSDIILFERVYSLYQCGKDCYMTNEEFTKLGCSERTVSACIGRLKKIGLVKVWIDRKYDGRIKDRRYIYVQPDRLKQIITERIKAAEEGTPNSCILLQPLELYLLEEQPLFEERTFEVPPFEGQAGRSAETQPLEETEQRPERREAIYEKPATK